MKLSSVVIMVCTGYCVALPPSTQQSTASTIKQTPVGNSTSSPLSIQSKTSDVAITPEFSSSSSSSSNNSSNDNSNINAFITTKKIQLTEATSPSPMATKETRESPGKIRPQIKLHMNYTSFSEQYHIVKMSVNRFTGVKLPEGASAALAKPTKYHYYPHNQHIYLLPECAVQQVCNAVYVRLNFTQPLCACPGRYRDPCSASLDADDQHTTELVTDPRSKALTLVKTCEPVAEMRECRAPKDWSLLALQNIRTGKSHYLVICRCPDTNILEGPMSHDQPTYASVPGIRVYGMMCVQGIRRGRPLRQTRNLLGMETEEDIFHDARKTFPWHKVAKLMESAKWD
ncbi:hypothetical protein PV325_002740 [Microctonus aethiopoides]|nr:hypothetical protein PV325_002740 [Microctonus aethiopoides]